MHAKYNHRKSFGILSKLLLVCAPLVGSLPDAYAQEEPSLGQIFQTSLTCALVGPLLVDVNVESLYEFDGNTCNAVVPDSSTDDYFLDASCTDPVDFFSTPLSRHCELLLDPNGLGEGDNIVNDAWTLSPGSRMNVGARSLTGVQQPYMQRTVYRSVSTAGGVCDLEMRIYSPRPGSTGHGSLLALHGGSWSARGFGFFGLEFTVPHFIDQGFVVYTPFYRLLGDSEGSAACHNASIPDIVSDAEAALTWVRENAANFGSNSVPVVFGQSAGGHLAASLAVNQPESVAAGILFYPPTDFTDFAQRVRQGFYTNSQGLGILDRVIGVSAEEADLNASPIPENSFPIRIVEGGLNVAPMMMVQGMQDDLVEPRQSARLCDALAGRELLAVDQEVSPIVGLRQEFTCGADSSLQLIREGQHALDVCLADLSISTDLCLSGSAASRREVAVSILDATNFASEWSVAANASTGAVRRGGGSVHLMFLALLFMVSARLITLRYAKN